MFAIVVSMLNLYMYCYFGAFTTYNFADYVQCLSNAEWYGLSIDIQHHFLMILRNAQLEVCYDGFGMIKLNLETFLKVTSIFFNQFFK